MPGGEGLLREVQLRLAAVAAPAVKRGQDKYFKVRSHFVSLASSFRPVTSCSPSGFPYSSRHPPPAARRPALPPFCTCCV